MEHILNRSVRTLVAAALAVLAALGAAQPAAAASRSASLGDVTATLTFRGHAPTYRDERLTIARAGTIVYDRPVWAAQCGHACGPLGVRVRDLDGDGSAEVLLDLTSGGPHCCAIEQVFFADVASYRKRERNFGDAGARLVDLDQDGRWEFLSADGAFADAFTAHASSGLPIQIMAFTAGRFHDVTTAYPRLIAADAARWLKLYRSMAKTAYVDSEGMIAAWAADESRLGHACSVHRFLLRQARAGHLNSALAGPRLRGRRFVTALERFLRRHGYLPA